MEIIKKKKGIIIVICIYLLLAFIMGWVISGDKFPTLTMFQRVLIGIGCMIVHLGFLVITEKVISLMYYIIYDILADSERQFVPSRQKNKEKLRKELWEHLKKTTGKFEVATIVFKGSGKSIEDFENLIVYVQEKMLPEIKESLKSNELDLGELQKIENNLINIDAFIVRLYQNV